MIHITAEKQLNHEKNNLHDVHNRGYRPRKRKNTINKHLWTNFTVMVGVFPMF